MSNSATDVGIAGSTVELTLTNPIKNDQSVEVSYTPPLQSVPSWAVKDLKQDMPMQVTPLQHLKTMEALLLGQRTAMKAKVEEMF